MWVRRPLKVCLPKKRASLTASMVPARLRELTSLIGLTPAFALLSQLDLLDYEEMCMVICDLYPVVGM
jgi:hypothetical protein